MGFRERENFEVLQLIILHNYPKTKRIRSERRTRLFILSLKPNCENSAAALSIFSHRIASLVKVNCTCHSLLSTTVSRGGVFSLTYIVRGFSASLRASANKMLKNHFALGGL
jgi:hypothetical protein